MRRVPLPPWDEEDRAIGNINCPSGAHGLTVNLRACNLQICYGCDPWVGFCFYCKQVLHDGIPCSSCHHGVSLSHIKELASNDAAKGSSEDDDDDDDDEEDDDDGDGDEAATHGAATLRPSCASATPLATSAMLLATDEVALHVHTCMCTHCMCKLHVQTAHAA